MTTRIDLHEIQTRVKNKILPHDFAARLLSLPLFEVPIPSLEYPKWREFFKDDLHYSYMEAPKDVILPFQEFLAVFRHHYFWIKMEGNTVSEVLVTLFGIPDKDNQICYLYTGYRPVYEPEPILEWRVAYLPRYKILRNPKELNFTPVGKLSNYHVLNGKTILNTGGTAALREKMDTNVANFTKSTVIPSLSVILSFFKFQQDCKQTAVTVEPAPNTEKPTKKELKGKTSNHTFGAKLGPRVIYLDRLPSVKAAEEASGKVRAPVCRHQRAAHGRTLKHPRFKNHPLYMVPNGLRIESYWVGPEEEVYQGNIYRIHKTA